MSRPMKDGELPDGLDLTTDTASLIIDDHLNRAHLVNRIARIMGYDWDADVDARKGGNRRSGRVLTRQMKAQLADDLVDRTISLDKVHGKDGGWSNGDLIGVLGDACGFKYDTSQNDMRKSQLIATFVYLKTGEGLDTDVAPTAKRSIFTETPDGNSYAGPDVPSASGQDQDQDDADDGPAPAETVDIDPDKYFVGTSGGGSDA